MSSILLINPYLPPAPQPSEQQQPGSGLAVAPLQGASAGNAKDNTASFSGSQSGQGQSSDQHAITSLFLSRLNPEMPPLCHATGSSIVNAQSCDRHDGKLLDVTEAIRAMPDPLPTSPYLKPA